MEINDFRFQAPQDATAFVIDSFAAKHIDETQLEAFLRKHTIRRSL